MFKTVIFILTLIFCIDIFAGDKMKIRKELTYLNLLNRFECNLGSNINNPQWICNETAPRGWGAYYGNKLKAEKINRKKVIRKKATRN